MDLNPFEKKIVETALLIRECENKLLELFQEGHINGTVHTCVGQEFIGAIMGELISSGDTVFSNHRGHGHFIGATNNLEGLIAEVMGKKTGVSSGIGGSQHLFAENFYSNGIQGGLMPISAGFAFSKKFNNQNEIAIIFVGDGTLGEGTFYETLNIASKWKLPLLIVVENNYYAQSTSMESVTSGNIEKRAHAFDIKYSFGDTWNWKELIKIFKNSINYVRKDQKPLVLEIETYRLNAHSKGDDNRNSSEIDDFIIKDPLNKLMNSNNADFSEIIKLIRKRINNSVSKSLNEDDCEYFVKKSKHSNKIKWQNAKTEDEIISKQIYLALKNQFVDSKNTFMIGEDIEGDYGGAFKVTKDLSINFVNRVKNTPISESSIIGIGTGLAMSGNIAITEIMFGDFMTLTFDQIINHATKFCEMFGSKIKIPLIIRTPMGGKRGYGPTHSQSLEKHFLGIPNLDIIALNQSISSKHVYETLFKNIENPVLIVENKLLYTKKTNVDPSIGFEQKISDEPFPTVKISPSEDIPDITIFCYGGILNEVIEASQKVFIENEILSEIICPSLINPINPNPLIESVEKTRKLLTVEDGPSVASLGSEVMAIVLTKIRGSIIAEKFGYDGIIPCSQKIEYKITPNASNISEKIKRICNG